MSESIPLQGKQGLQLADDTSELNAPEFNPPMHGGDVRTASLHYGIAIDNWLDLSTGINPDAYPIPAIPDRYFRNLPDRYNTELIAAAKHYYGCVNLLPAAGSQRFIELLPMLRSHCRVAIPDVGYQEHHYHWQRCGHYVWLYSGWQPEQLTQKIVAGDIDVVVLINPCNPTAAVVNFEQIDSWRKQLAQRGGWLIIDEAFADLYSKSSFAGYSHLPAVIVLRSLGKFFGLAGVRVGFALAAEELVHVIAKALGPWSITGPSQYIATKALMDSEWQHCARKQLSINSQWMQETLHRQLHGVIDLIVSATLFVSVRVATDIAEFIYMKLAERAILVRMWQLAPNKNHMALLRFGLISEDNPAARQRFQIALEDIRSALATIPD